MPCLSHSSRRFRFRRSQLATPVMSPRSLIACCGADGQPRQRAKVDHPPLLPQEGMPWRPGIWIVLGVVGVRTGRELACTDNLAAVVDRLPRGSPCPPSVPRSTILPLCQRKAWRGAGGGRAPASDDLATIVDVERRSSACLRGFRDRAALRPARERRDVTPVPVALALLRWGRGWLIALTSSYVPPRVPRPTNPAALPQKRPQKSVHCDPTLPAT